MKKQSKTNRYKKLSIVTVIIISFLFIANSSAVAQENWAKGEEWRGKYKIGDKVQYTVSGNESDFQTCIVTENNPKDLMRVRCETFKYWSAGIYYGSTEKVFRPIQTVNTPANNSQTNDKSGADETSTATTYKVGSKLEVLYGSTWYKAEILEAKDGSYKIHYDNYGSNWDEWVKPERMRPIGGTTQNVANDNGETQKKWSVNDKWRSGFMVGDKIKMSISGKAEDLQTCTVTENEPEAVMRAKCEDFKDWKAGVNIVSEFQVNVTVTPATASTNKPTKQGNSTSLKIGEYACTGSGGRMMIGLGFKVTSGNRYTDLDGKRSGTFTIAGGKITFRGGHLQGVTGRDLSDNWFTVASQARCGPY